MCDIEHNNNLSGSSILLKRMIIEVWSIRDVEVLLWEI